MFCSPHPLPAACPCCPPAPSDTVSGFKEIRCVGRCRRISPAASVAYGVETALTRLAPQPWHADMDQTLCDAVLSLRHFTALSSAPWVASCPHTRKLGTRNPRVHAAAPLPRTATPHTPLAPLASKPLPVMYGNPHTQPSHAMQCTAMPYTSEGTAPSASTRILCRPRSQRLGFPRSLILK